MALRHGIFRLGLLAHHAPITAPRLDQAAELLLFETPEPVLVIVEAPLEGHVIGGIRGRKANDLITRGPRLVERQIPLRLDLLCNDVEVAAGLLAVGLDISPGLLALVRDLPLELFEPPVDALEPPVDLFEPPVDLLEPLVDLLEPLVDLLEPLVDLLEPLVDLLEPLVDLLEPLVDLLEPLVHVSLELLHIHGASILPSSRCQSRAIEICTGCVR